VVDISPGYHSFGTSQGSGRTHPTGVQLISSYQIPQVSGLQVWEAEQHQ